MRVFTLLCTTVVVACFNPTISYGQGTEQQHRSDEQSEPYHKHHDTRHGHDHFYPDRGAIVRDLPRGTIGTSYAGVSYRYHDGIWLEPRGPAFMVIAPPVGLVAPTLPLYSTVVTHGGESFLYVNDTYYRPRPDLNGYEVVNDPFEESAPAAPEALVGGQLPGAAPAATPPPPTALTGGAISAAIPAAAISTGVSAASIPATAVPAAATLGSAAAPATAQAETARISAQTASFPPPAATSMTVASAPASNLAAAAAPSATPYRPSAGTTAMPIPVPAGSTAASLAPEAPKGPKVFLYPKNGQTSDQQARDRYDCYRFAVAQSGYDPMHSTGAAGELQSDYERAQSACFEARGYASR